jgi:ABC-type molybdate transport system substrate-binding protein
MRVEPLTPDIGPMSQLERPDAGGFAKALEALGDVLSGAQRSEDAYANGSGTLQRAIYERARADVALSVATATAQHLAQSIQSILNMQV